MKQIPLKKGPTDGAGLGPVLIQIDKDFFKKTKINFFYKKNRRGDRKFASPPPPTVGRDTAFTLTGWAHGRRVLDFPQLSVTRTGHGGRGEQTLGGREQTGPDGQNRNANSP